MPTPVKPTIVDLIVELVKRFGAKSPKIFQYIIYAGYFVMIITGLPELFEKAGIVLPVWATILQSKGAAIAALVGTIIAKLPVQNTPVIVTDDKVVSEARAEILPFTVKAEAVAAEKEADKPVQ